MSHILVVGCGPAGISAALRLAERGQKVTLASAKPPIYHRCAGLPGIDLPEDAAQELRDMGAQSLSGHEVMHALSRRLLRYESDGTLRFLPYHRLLQLAVGGGRCVGGVLLNEHAWTLEGVRADAVLLASGGMHTMFSKNRYGCDGLAATLAFQAGAALRNPDQINTSGRYPIFEGGLITSWDGETTVPGLYAAGECANGTTLAFPFAQAMVTGTASADHLSEGLPEVDTLEAGCALTAAVTGVQQLLDIFRRTRGTRAPAAVERRIRETVQRTMTGKRTARLLQRGLLDIRVMRQQAGRGGYDLGEGLYPALRLPSLLQLLEVMLTTAAYRLLRQDGDLTAVLREGRIDVTAKRNAATEVPDYLPEPSAAEAAETPPDEPQEEAQEKPREKLIGVGSALQNAAADEFAAKYNVPRKPKKKPQENAPAPAAKTETDEIAAAISESFLAESGLAPALADIAPTGDTIAFQPFRARGAEGAQAAAAPVPGQAQAQAPAPAQAAAAAPGQVQVLGQVPVQVPVMAQAAAPGQAKAQGQAAVPGPVQAQASAQARVPVPIQAQPAKQARVPVPIQAQPAAQARVPVPIQAQPSAQARVSGQAQGQAAAPVQAKRPVFASEIVLEHDPLKNLATAEPPASAVPEVKKAAAEVSPVKPEARRERVFTPDPEALLALAESRKASGEPVPRAEPAAPVQRKAYAVFNPDPEELLSISKDT